VTNHRNEGGFHLLGLSEAGNVAHRSDDVEQITLFRDQRRVSDAHRQGRVAIGTLQIAFHVQGGMRSQRPATGDCLFERHLLGFLGPGDDLVMRTVLQRLKFFANHVAKGRIAAFHAQVGKQDQNAIRSGIEQRVDPAPVIIHLPVKLGIVDGNSRLVSKARQQDTIIGAEGRKLAKDEDHAHITARSIQG